MSEWYYADRQGQQQGPVQTEDLLALRNAGQVGMDTLVWRNGMANWQAFSTVANEIMPPPAAPEAAAPVPAPVVDGSYSMYAAAPVAQQANDPYAAPRAQVGSDSLVVQGGHIVYAGFWKRVAAYAIDTILLAVASFVIGLAVGVGAMASGYLSSAQIGAQLLGFAVAWLYAALLESSGSQATLGKMAVGIKVTDSDGERLSLLHATGRFLAKSVPTIIIVIGAMKGIPTLFAAMGLAIIIGLIDCVAAAFTDRKRAVHDMAASTLVVDKWAFTDHPEWQDDRLGTVTKIVLGLLGLLAALYFIGVFFALTMGLAGH